MYEVITCADDESKHTVLAFSTQKERQLPEKKMLQYRKGI